MDALFALSSIIIVLVAIAALSSVLGVDSREGFANERRRSGLS